MESKRNARLNCDSKIIKALKLPRSTAYNVLKRYKETGRASERPRSAMTPQMIKSVGEKIRRNPERNISQLAREAHVGHATMLQIVTNDLGERSYKNVERQLSEATRLKRLQRGKQLLSAGTRCPIIWTDEKSFTVQSAHNRQNDRILSKNIDIPPNIRVVSWKKTETGFVHGVGRCDLRWTEDPSHFH